MHLLHNKLVIEPTIQAEQRYDCFFLFFFFPVLWLSKNSWTVKIKVTSYIFQKIIILKSLSFCYGVFLLPTKKLLKFSKRVIQNDSNSYPWLLFYFQPHSITVNWFDVSTALLPHTAVPIYKIHMFIISSLPFLGILQTNLMTWGRLLEAWLALTIG